MDRFLQTVFLAEIEMQCKLIRIGSAELDRARSIDQDIGERVKARPVDTEALRRLNGESQDSIAQHWFILQGILIAAANLQKLFWGSGGRKKGQRQGLRELLEVSDESCLHDPDLRNDFEHFDERIEHRIAEQGQTGYIARNIGPAGEDFLCGEEPHTRFGHYDPATGDLSFWAHSVNVFEIVKEASRVLELVQAETMRPLWVQDAEEPPAAEVT